jgi:peptidoglycan/xylan/chitin deacetylase (PgdA/CDA1 family)
VSALASLRVMSGLSGQRVIFPFYHTVSCSPRNHIRHLYKCRSEKEFEKDLDFMLRYFEPISIEDYLKTERRGKKRQMVLSFDDGLVECHEFIAPFLKKKGVPALFFLNNDFIDNRGLFYRYRASMLIDHIQKDRCRLTRAAEYLAIPDEQVVPAILMIRYKQQPLLDSLAMELEFDEASKLKEEPVYMSTEQIKDLKSWGFHLGAHSHDHPEFFDLPSRNMEGMIHKSMKDLQKRFGAGPACFAFPFTSDGVPRQVIEQVLADGIADILFGTAGLKRTGNERFVQRIPMENKHLSASRVLRTEYLYYLLKGPLGQNHYFNAS